MVQDIELPPELRSPIPRVLPAWARRTHVSETIIGVALAVSLVTLGLAREVLLASAVLAVAVIAALVASAIRRSRCRLLREGAAVAGTVVAVGINRRRDAIRFTYETPAGLITSVSHVDRRLAAAVGDHPRPGDTVFVVYDPKGVGRNELWGAARGPSHDTAAATEFLRISRSRRALFVGAFLFATCGLPITSWLVRRVAPTRVATCEASYSHHFWFVFTFEDRSRLTLTDNELSLSGCPAPGSRFEKRRGEFAYRLDGVPRGYNRWSVLVPGVLAVAGGVTLVIGVVLSLRASPWTSRTRSC